MVLATTADDPIRPTAGRREMHRARLAAGNTTLAAIELGEHRIQRPALGDIEAMRAIGRKHQVIGTQGITDADSDRLLADRQMDRALDLVGGIEVDDPLFNEPDQQRRPEQATVQFVFRSQITTLPVLGRCRPLLARGWYRRTDGLAIHSRPDK